ncbi:uncharacterized protein LOC117039112 [Lacerta agilis]|uniref:uncharacterized protein LOC117039112 n=1 Tax=Lacerta agilis TaxID=80427 RepID=UPI001419E640|nr:uncharacterized protein LOC117039112 [Lacerta agilis]
MQTVQVLKTPDQPQQQGGPPARPVVSEFSISESKARRPRVNNLPQLKGQLLEKDQLYLLEVIQNCQAAQIRGLQTLKCSKQEPAKAIMHIFGHLEHFRDCPLASEALLQLSFMRPHFGCDMVSAILYRTMEAVLGGAEKEEDKEELKRHFQSLLGGLLLEAPNAGTLHQLLADLRFYALWRSDAERKLAASSISLLLAVSRRFPHLRVSILPFCIHFFGCFHLPKSTSPSIF